MQGVREVVQGAGKYLFSLSVDWLLSRRQALQEQLVGGKLGLEGDRCAGEGGCSRHRCFVVYLLLIVQVVVPEHDHAHDPDPDPDLVRGHDHAHVHAHDQTPS